MAKESADNSPVGYISIDGLRIFARHGVMPQETAGGNVFELDIRLSFPCRKAMECDTLEDTVNYAEVVEIAKAEMAVPSRLLEHVVGRIRDAVIRRFPQITGGRIALRKMRPPISAELHAAGFAYEW